MKKLNPLLSTSLLSVFLLAITLLTSCKQKCKNEVCKNGGVCIEPERSGNASLFSAPVTQQCTCPVGYSGMYCDTETRMYLLGNYVLSGTDDSGGTYTNLTSSVTTSTAGIEKLIVDVSGTFTLTGTVSSEYKFIIDPVTIAGYSYSGHADLVADGLSLSVTKTDGMNMKVYTLTGSKQ